MYDCMSCIILGYLLELEDYQKKCGNSRVFLLL
jgi:hypothetical protein